MPNMYVCMCYYYHYCCCSCCYYYYYRIITVLLNTGRRYLKKKNTLRIPITRGNFEIAVTRYNLQPT